MLKIHICEVLVWTGAPFAPSEASQRHIAVEDPSKHQAGLLCVQYAIDYHLAPEQKWPGHIDENEFVVRWLFDHANERGVDAQKASFVCRQTCWRLDPNRACA